MKCIVSIFLIFSMGMLSAQPKKSEEIVESLYELMQFEYIGKNFIDEARKQVIQALSTNASGLGKNLGGCMLIELQDKDAVMASWKMAVTDLLATQADLTEVQEVAASVATEAYYLVNAENLVLQLSHASQEELKTQYQKIVALIYQNKAFYERSQSYEKLHPHMNVMTIARPLALPAIGTKQAIDKVTQQLTNNCKQK